MGGGGDAYCATACKGAVAVLFVRAYLPPGCEIFAALAAVLGHIFPVWLKFKGGKGVATFMGVTTRALLAGGTAGRWRPGCWRALIWRISSLSALIAIALVACLFLRCCGQRDYARWRCCWRC